ncbi:hypothetical protein BCV70DRAFT_149671, partial [Testicularia cyperi]
PRRRFRINRLLGRIVPIIILVYVSYTYDLVVVRYAYRYLYRVKGQRLVPILWLGPAHAVFLIALRAYLRVFLAHGTQPGNRYTVKGIQGWLRSILGANFPSPSPESDGQVYLDDTMDDGETGKVTIQYCQADGQPVRCWRDQCGGRIKAFRTRHCGDCGVCRVGFDHHCAWFDNDVTGPATLRPFLVFLGCVPTLVGLVLGPLLPAAWKVTKEITHFAASDPGLVESWWSKWYSWVGGPAFRWMVGWVLGARHWSSFSAPLASFMTPRLPIIVAFGGIFVSIASILAYSTVSNLAHGKLTIDVERERARQRLLHKCDIFQAQVKKGTRSPDYSAFKLLEKDIDTLSSVSYFLVRLADKSALVPLSPKEDGLFDYGGVETNL